MAPGTAGSLAGLAVFAAIRWAGSPVLEVSVLSVLLIGGVWSSTVAGRYFGLPDPQKVVIDEVVGTLLTLLLLRLNWAGALVGFLLFRLFDVTKPYPVSSFERLPGGFGVMADDVMAGIYAHVVLWMGLQAFPGWLA
jgi:phosphatidylglycerophosphatase A